VGLSVDEQQNRRDWFRGHWQNGVAFNRFCNMSIQQWDADGAQILLPYSDHLCSHQGIVHGGVVSALLDVTATGAVISGHDFTLGSRLTTISLNVQFLATAPGEDLLGIGQCTRRGRSVNFAEARAIGVSSGTLVATAHVVAYIAGERAGAPWVSKGR
jgi:uncharacterized protein (TIGR00369 family)